MNTTVYPVGGKAAGLDMLRKNGLPVPPYALWQEDVFSPALHELHTGESVPDEAAFLRQRVLETPWDPLQATEVRREFLGLTEYGRFALAVRSSAADEDGHGLSLAGQMDTFLNVRSMESTLTAIRACQASVFSDRAVSYRKRNGLDWKGVKLTVILQRQLDADVSGVLFTRDWSDKPSDRMVVSSLWGLGEGLVGGALDADTFSLDEKGRVIECRPAFKKEKFAASPEGGTDRFPVREELSHVPSLTDAQLRSLHRDASRLRRSVGTDVDVEFAVKDARLYFLQVRPITHPRPAGAPRAPGGPNAKRCMVMIWDNSNITESYPGITSPLTFSFIRRAYGTVYRQFCEILGVPERVIRENSDVFSHMLGHLKGRVYYNLMSWYRLVSFLPGFSFNKSFLEEMMGLSRVRDFVPPSREMGALRRYFIELPSLARVGLKMLAAFLFLERRARRFFRDFYLRYRELEGVDWDSRSLEDLLAAKAMLENEILARWKTPILNDFKCMIFFGLLRRLCQAWIGGQSIANDLIAGEPGIKSKEAVDGLFALARMAQDDDGPGHLLREKEPKEAWKILKEGGCFPRFLEAVENYLREFGTRGVEEMKLESPTLRDQPEFLLGMVRNALENPGPTEQARKDRERERRAAAERSAKRKLKGLRRPLFSLVLDLARQAVRSRENQRFCRSEIYGVVRELVRSCGRRLAAAGALCDPSDVFFLELEEIISAFDGTATTDRFNELARLRRTAFLEYAGLSLPDDLETEGPVYAGLDALLTDEHAFEGGETLKGIGAGPGVFEGPARVLDRPDAATRLRGEVLVASFTDPGWALVFPGIGALVVEHGSLLSHSAIIAREMGIPAVVGVKDATRRLRNGDRVRVDGDTGIVSVLRSGSS